ncbi:uncharacterized protein [Palaemon carinicauda]|uniref:uncharacterized protein n=1 Tax=Palaemon carinicauda TaxID=392227 RepID=UPI0035B5DCDD
MANVTYTGASSTSPLIVSSSGGSGVGSPCEPREPPPLPGGMGVGMGGYDLMTYQRLASALYAHPPHATLDPTTPTSIPPTTPTLLAGHDPLLHKKKKEKKKKKKKKQPNSHILENV